MSVESRRPEGRSVIGSALGRGMIRAGHFFFRFRDLLFPLVFLALIAGTRARWPWGRRDLEIASNGLALLLMVSGQLLRALVIGFAYVRRGGKNRQIFAESLVVEGFFAHSRNPLYLGNLLGLLGLLVLHDSPLGYAVGIPFFAFAYAAIIAAEEDYLVRRFGSVYDQYCRRVPRLLPSFAGLRQTLADMRFDWRRLVRKEYGTTFAGVTAVCALLVWDDYQRLGSAEAGQAARVLLWVWVPAAAAYLTARWLKKRGSLGTG